MPYVTLTKRKIQISDKLHFKVISAKTLKEIFIMKKGQMHEENSIILNLYPTNIKQKLI